MPRYWQIRDYPKVERTRTLDRLLALRVALDEQIARGRPDNLLLATWNIRDFDSNKFGHGPRLRESFHYLAEIIARFDLIAIQEVNRDLEPLRRLLYLLGPNWDYIVTGVTEGPSGNEERMAFLIDRHRVRFTNLAGQVVLPKAYVVTSTARSPNGGSLQFARAPYVASFQAGWFKFNLCTVHIYFGKDSGTALERRIDEINKVAAHFKRLQAKEAADYILLGDFNIVSPEHRTMQALSRNGFRVPEPLQGFTTNLGKNKHYDQIAFRQHDKRLEFGSAGVLDFRDAVFRDEGEDFEAYFKSMPAKLRDFHASGRKKGKRRTAAEKRSYYSREWITWQMSDHMLLWVELKVDFTNDYLASLKPAAEPLADPRD
jgi:endonuclease/exonuclease/phosphatase family metal-dependent hydrolase